MKYCWIFDTSANKDIYVENGIVDLEKCGVKRIKVYELPKANNMKPTNEFLNGFIKGWNEFRNRLMYGKDEGGRWAD